MFSQYFGQYLVGKNKISQSQYEEILNYQKTIRVKLGLIAVAEKMLTQKQADEVNQLQATMDKRFGDIAVEKGYLTDEQVGQLLKMQGNPYMQFIQSATELNIMDMAQIESSLTDFQQENQYSDSDLDAMKSGDIDRILPLFVKIDAPFYQELIGLALRNVNRFISTNICFGKAEQLTTLPTNTIALQKVDGDHQILLAFAGEGDALLSIAVPYADEAFESVDADAFDAVEEFINCINGLFASKLSHENVDIDMLPPEYYNQVTLSADQAFYMVPVSIDGKNVKLIISIDNPVSIN